MGTHLTELSFGVTDHLSNGLKSPNFSIGDANYLAKDCVRRLKCNMDIQAKLDVLQLYRGCVQHD